MKRANFVLSLIGLCLLGLKLGNATNSNDNGPSVALTRQAVELGMDPTVLGELWRSKQPVVISKPNAVGQPSTTTYELSADGQKILSNTVNEDPPTTKLEVTTSTPSPVSPQTDWEYLPSTTGQRRTFTTTPLANDWPSFGGFPQWSSPSHTNPGWPSFEIPAGVTPQTSTKTEQDDQGRTVTTTIKTFRSPLSFSSWSSGTPLATNWPRFDFPAGVTPEVSTKTELDDQGRTVTTTTKTYKGTLPNNFAPEGATGSLPESWQPRRNIFDDQLNSFLYGSRAARPSLTPNNAQPVPTPLPLPSRPTVLPPLPTRPNIQQPLATPVPKTIATFNSNNLPSFVNINELPTNTRVTSYSGTFNGAAPPRAADLEPPVRDMLSNAGITDDDIRQAQERGENIVRNRVMPDGRVIKTTVRLNSMPVAYPEASLPSSPPQVVRYQPQPEVRQNQPQDKTIDNYLSQVNLRPEDILAQNGEVVKTIVDKDGRVLSAKFVLSTVKNDEHGNGQGQAELPTK